MENHLNIHNFIITEENDYLYLYDKNSNFNPDYFYINTKFYFRKR